MKLLLSRDYHRHTVMELEMPDKAIHPFIYLLHHPRFGMPLRVDCWRFRSSEFGGKFQPGFQQSPPE
jgi:hypothetical protein